jgi:hypothetical protein
MRILILTAAIAALAACSQGPNEEAGEAADTAYEQSTTGTTDAGQGPMEEAGEHLDQATEGAPATPPAETPATPPATTP